MILACATELEKRFKLSPEKAINLAKEALQHSKSPVSAITWAKRKIEIEKRSK